MVADFTGIPWRKLHTEPPEALRADWLGLSWQARGLYALILAAANESGEVLLGRAGLRSVAALVQASWSDIEEPLRELLDSGWAAHHIDRSTLGLPYFGDSQKACSSRPGDHHRARPYNVHRAAVLERDQRRCRYCGRAPNVLGLDHIVPPRLGGGHGQANLVTCCVSCNSRKGSRPPEWAGMSLLPIPGSVMA